MCIQISKCLVVMAFSSLAQASIAAQVLNGGFETGSFDGWTLFGGYARVIQSELGIPAIQGNHSALLVVRGGQGICENDDWSTACPTIPTGLPSAAPGGPDLTYSALFAPPIANVWIGQQFQAKAGDIVSVKAQFFTNEVGGGSELGPTRDRAFISIISSTTFSIACTTLFGCDGFAVGVDFTPPLPTSVSLVPVGSLIDAPASTGFTSMTMVPVTWGMMFPVDGLFTLALGVAHDDDSFVSSGVLFDIAQIGQVSEPSALALLSISLAGLAGMRRRRV